MSYNFNKKPHVTGVYVWQQNDTPMGSNPAVASSQERKAKKRKGFNFLDKLLSLIIDIIVNVLASVIVAFGNIVTKIYQFFSALTRSRYGSVILALLVLILTAFSIVAYRLWVPTVSLFFFVPTSGFMPWFVGTAVFLGITCLTHMMLFSQGLIVLHKALAEIVSRPEIKIPAESDRDSAYMVKDSIEFVSNFRLFFQLFLIAAILIAAVVIEMSVYAAAIPSPTALGAEKVLQGIGNFVVSLLSTVGLELALSHLQVPNLNFAEIKNQLRGKL